MPLINPIQLISGFLLAIIISWLAVRARSLNNSGAMASTILGTIVFGLGGLPWAILLMGFFISSSGLSRLFSKRKRNVNEKFSKGSQRDAAQVLANGGISGLFVILHTLYPQAAWPWLAFAGTLAAVNADTWATELGVLSRTSPRLITTGRLVEKGTSGGITIEGTLAAFSGAALIALLSVLFPGILNSGVSVMAQFLIISFSGLAGSLLDSLLGATVQIIYTCPTCQKETERHPLHVCGTATTRLRGWNWFDNDWVNIACALLGALLAMTGIFL